MEPRTLIAGLNRCLPAAMPGVRVMEVRRLTGGASQQLWSVIPENGEPLVARLAGNWNMDLDDGALDLATEAAVMSAAKDAGVPVPDVRYVFRQEDGVGSGFLMEHVPGETLPHRLLRDERYETARERLTGDCARAMALVHQVTPHGLPSLPTLTPARAVAQQDALYRQQGSDLPVFEFALRWLKANTPAETDTALVHGDFRNGNLVVDSSGLASVLDWEAAHLGDPMEDLGWFCVNAWRFGRIDLPAGGFGSRQALFETYQAASGRQVDADRVFFWEVFGTLRWGVICVGMARAFSSGADPSLERGAIGRRASETELDLLRLLAAESCPGKMPALRPRAGERQPPGPELLAAVQRFLRQEACPALEGPAVYHARIAARLVEMMQRELALGTAAGQRELSGLRRLLARDGELADLRRALCRSIADGRMPTNRTELLDHLWLTTLDTMAIDQPDYAAYRAVAPATTD